MTIRKGKTPTKPTATTGKEKQQTVADDNKEQRDTGGWPNMSVGRRTDT